IRAYQDLGCEEMRATRALEIYREFILRRLVRCSQAFAQSSIVAIQSFFNRNQYPPDLFQAMVELILRSLSDTILSQFLNSKMFTRFCQWKNLQLNIHPVMANFRIEALNGRMPFGETYKCEKVDTGKIYTMKCLDKKRLRLKQAENLALNERAMLVLLSREDCAFITRLTYAFQTPDKLCLILDYTDGGNLQTLMHDGELQEMEARFYAAEMILGLEYLHKHSVVHRDLKPSNVALSTSGHLKIANMSLACDFARSLPTATIGTIGYMAPEVVEQGTAYNSSADWFSLGCVLHRLVQDHTPFHLNKSDDKRTINHRTLTMPLDLSVSFSPDLTSLLRGLLERVVKRRLRCTSRGADEIKGHPFFAEINWHRVAIQEYPTPLKPCQAVVRDSDLFPEEDNRQRVTWMTSDVELYRKFPLTIAERWEEEVVETVFCAMNEETDRAEVEQAAGQCSLDSET
uniref:beta-adrenergic receptor kinase 1-like n=1 Tax=Pristiophorus japonicus TaxID=55135 RepID=UPI00398F460D